MDVIRAERVELLDGMRAILRGGNIVVAGEQQRWDFRARKAHDAFAPFALKSWCGGTIAVGIASKNDQVDVFINGSVDDEIQGFQEVHHALGQSGRSVVLTVIGHVDMGISKVQEFDHGVIIMYGLFDYLVQALHGGRANPIPKPGYTNQSTL